eukprot:TRINITY_DN2085_c0_g1_i8.p1 TRINITY_DN2085_c0_g1~~TRINITY_DN2085_c0_g1_i8.p1  ORF type:complete len:279 (+),score=44.90 TRINITY_DN2085_c0_g1_i8:121-957(+)
MAFFNSLTKYNVTKEFCDSISQIPGVVIDSKEKPPVILNARSFFVAHHGTLTLAFEGWPERIVEMKKLMEERIVGLNKEFFGTKWPKVTFGVLPDGYQMSRKQFSRLLSVCKYATESLILSTKEQYSNTEAINDVQFVVIKTRSLEFPNYEQCNLDLRSGFGSPYSPQKFSFPPQQIPTPLTQSSIGYVESVLAEAEDSDFYFERANDCSRRISFYTQTLEPDKTEFTLVHFLTNENLITLISKLREIIEKDEELKGIYQWLPEASLHISVRAVVPIK